MDKIIPYQTITLAYRIEGNAITAPAEAGATSVGTGTIPVGASATPVVLVHGFAEDGRIWESQCDYLSSKYRLIIPDLPGSGRSAPLHEPTSMDQLADAILAILDAESIRQCIMIGHSMGGYVTLAFAEKYPERLKAIGLFHSTAFPDTEEKKEIRRKWIAFIQKNGAAPFIRQSTPNLFSPFSQQRHKAVIDQLINAYSSFDAGSLIRYYEAMIARPDRTGVLSGFHGPVLFIIGEQDNAAPMASVLQQVHLPSSADVHLLGQTGHMGMLEDTSRCNGILNNFIRFSSAYPFH